MQYNFILWLRQTQVTAILIAFTFILCYLQKPVDSEFSNSRTKQRKRRKQGSKKCLLLLLGLSFLLPLSEATYTSVKENWWLLQLFTPFCDWLQKNTADWLTHGNKGDVLYQGFKQTMIGPYPLYGQYQNCHLNYYMFLSLICLLQGWKHFLHKLSVKNKNDQYFVWPIVSGAISCAYVII